MGFLLFFSLLGESQSYVKVGVCGILQADMSLFCPCFKPTGQKPALLRKPFSCLVRMWSPSPVSLQGLFARVWGCANHSYMSSASVLACVWPGWSAGRVSLCQPARYHVDIPFLTLGSSFSGTSFSLKSAWANISHLGKQLPKEVLCVMHRFSNLGIDFALLIFGLLSPRPFHSLGHCQSPSLLAAPVHNCIWLQWYSCQPWKSL